MVHKVSHLHRLKNPKQTTTTHFKSVINLTSRSWITSFTPFRNAFLPKLQHATGSSCYHRLHITTCYTGIQSELAAHRKIYLRHRVLYHIWRSEKFLGSYMNIPKSEQTLYSHLSLPLLKSFEKVKERNPFCPQGLYHFTKTVLHNFWKRKKPRQESSLRIIFHQFWVYLGKAGSLSNNFY